MGGWLNRWLHRPVFDFVWASTSRDGVNACRAASGMPPLASSPLHSLLSSTPTLLLFSSSLLPKPNDYPPHATIVGAPPAPLPAPLPPLPPHVDAFLSAPNGSAVVLITLGSMSEYLDAEHSADASRRGAHDVMRLVAVAAASLGLRALVMADESLAPFSSPLPFSKQFSTQTLCVCSPSVPHALLLPRVACVACHGGSGTAHAALRHGVPVLALAVQTQWDQLFWVRGVILTQG